MDTVPRTLLMGPGAVRAGLASLVTVARQPEPLRQLLAWQEALDVACLHLRQSWRLFKGQLAESDVAFVRAQCRIVYHALRAGRMRPAVIDRVCRAVLALQDEATRK